MFNWLKNKLNNLIPSDINKGFLTSNYVTVKVGNKITIPENVVCFVSFHDKVYAELKSGNHCFDKELFPILYKKQKKNKKNLKKLNIDLFFINLNKQTLKTTYFDKILVKRKITMFNFEIEATANVVETKTLNKFICAEFYQPIASNTNKFINNLIENFVKKCFIKICLNDTIVSQTIIDEIYEKLKKYLSKIGLNLSSFKLTTTSKNSKNSIFNRETEDKTNNLFAEKFSIQSENPANIVDQTKGIDYNQNDVKQKNSNTCSNCGAKIIKGSLFCHRCGHNL